MGERMPTLSMRGWVAGAIALAFSGVAIAETLKEVVTFTIESNPQVTSSETKKDAADSAIEAAKGGYYPKIDFLYGTGREQSQNLISNANPATPGFPNRPGYLHLNRKQEGLVLNQMLWDGLGVESEVTRRSAISV